MKHNKAKKRKIEKPKSFAEAPSLRPRLLLPASTSSAKGQSLFLSETSSNFEEQSFDSAEKHVLMDRCNDSGVESPFALSGLLCPRNRTVAVRETVNP